MDDLGLMLIEYIQQCALEGGGISLHARVFPQYRYLTPSPNHACVKDIDQAYTLSLERGPTWRMWVPPEREGANFLLLPRVTSCI